MEIREYTQDNVLVLGPVGRLDSLTCRDFETRLLAVLDTHAQVVIDCAALDYISSAGLRVLLVAAKRSQANNGRLVLAALKDNLREVFDISGFSVIFEIHPTTAAAIAALE